MKISESTYKQMPSELKSLFIKLPNCGSEEVLELMPETKSGTAIRHNSGGNTFGGETPKPLLDDLGYGDSGSAARFFMKCEWDGGLDTDSAARFNYCAKASKRDRDEGCEGLEVKSAGLYGEFAGDGRGRQTEHQPARNNHPTVKPTSLMRYLCRLITPPNGLILDPFMGSGSTGKAAILEGFRFIGLDITEEYMPIAEARVKWAEKNVGIGVEEGDGEEQEARGEDGVDPTLF